ncbi:hypothetical protein ID866_12651, partial [Astraeus odoratus]
AAAEAREQQQADSEAQVSRSIPVGIKKRSVCGLCMKAKERCKWPEVEMTASRARMSPMGRECKKQAKKVADDDEDDEIVILSSQKTKRQGGISSHMDIANGHLEKIQQVLLSKLVEITSAAGSGGSKEVIEDQEELKEPQGEELGEDALGNELEDGAGAEDGTGEEAQKKDKGKGKEKAL